VRRFVLQKFNLVYDIFMHDNRQFYFQLGRKVIDKVWMLIICFWVIIIAVSKYLCLSSIESLTIFAPAKSISYSIIYFVVGFAVLGYWI
jgi:hypothetical protein